MKKSIKLFSMIIAASILTGCNSSTAPSDTTSKEEIVYKYEEDQMYQKIWTGNVIYNESCLLVKDTNTGKISARLLYKPTRIISVRDYTLEKEYKADEYVIEDDYLVATDKSTMPFLTDKNVACTDMTGIEGIIGTYPAKNGNILFTEGTGIVMHHVFVTYEHEDSWFGTTPIEQGNKLPRLQQKLNNQEQIKMVVNGDSIFTGCNSSGKLGIKPFQDDFPTGFANEITRKYGSEVVLHNTAVGGQVSNWGMLNVANNVNMYDPDLVIIGFGMNDGCDAFQVKPNDYVEHIKTMIDSIQYNCTSADIIVCATIVANPDSTQNYLQRDYLQPLKDMAEEYDDVVIMDMTTFSDDLLTKKKSLDLYANNINHPSDFMVRCYVQNLMTTIEDKK